MNLNRSKSSNICRYPSFLDNLNCQDIEQTQQIQERRINLWKQQCLDLEWIKIIQNKYKQGIKTKINIKKQKPKNKVKQPIKKLGLYLVTDSLNYKQKPVILTTKINKQQNLTFGSAKKNLPFSKPLQKSSCPQSSMGQVKLSIKSGLNQQSTNQQQQKQLSIIKEKIKIQPTYRIDNYKNDIKMLEYKIQIQKLNLEISKLKNQLQKYREINVNKNQTQLEDSVVDKQDVQEFKRQIMEQIQNKNNVIKQRNMLMAQLNQVLKQNYNQQIILKQKINYLQSELSSYQQLTFEQKTYITHLKSILNSKQQSYKQIQDEKQKLCLQLKQVKIQNQCMEIQIQKLHKQNKDLNIILNDTQQKYTIQYNELQDQCTINEELKKVIADKDSLMDRYKDKIYNLENSNSQLKANLQQLVDQLQRIKRQSALTQAHVQQLKISQQIKSQQLISLQQMIKKQQSIQETSLQIQKKKQLKNYIHEIAHILNIKQQITQEDIVEQIKNITHWCNYYRQTFHSYLQIIEILNINIQDNQYHQKLIYQILQLRNNMGVLVKKIKSMDNKIYYLSKENTKLNSRAKHGYNQALGGLEKIVQQQNQEIIKYRLKFRNFDWKNQL